MHRSSGDNIQEIFGAIGEVGPKWGFGQVVRNTRRLVGNLPTADFYLIWPRHVNPCPLETSWNGCSKIFRLGVVCSAPLPIKNLKIEGGQTGTVLRPGTKCTKRYCSLHIVVQGPAREFPISGPLFVRRTVSELNTLFSVSLC